MIRYAVIILVLIFAAAYAADKPKEAAQPASGEKFQCGGKTKCSEMKSCEEAKFYLKKCGISRLDRDKDGIPCESLCK